MLCFFYPKQLHLDATDAPCRPGKEVLTLQMILNNSVIFTFNLIIRLFFRRQVDGKTVL